ncbi:NusA-like transcription termination signal-binding factor [archaeon]|nr:NusA-like transcription termination signal-binding factor [archaeon]
MSIKFDISVIKFINLFEKITRASVKDVIVKENKMTFIVNEGNLGKAVGKGGVNVKKLENMFKKRIKIVEFKNDVCEFIRNLLLPLKISNIYKEDNLVKIKAEGMKIKSILIGRDKRNLKELRDTVKRYFQYDVEIE